MRARGIGRKDNRPCQQILLEPRNALLIASLDVKIRMHFPFDGESASSEPCRNERSKPKPGAMHRAGYARVTDKEI